MKLNKSLLSLMIMTVATVAFFCGVGATTMMSDIKAAENTHVSIAIPRPITMMSTNDDISINCGNSDKIWQPAVLTVNHAQDTRFIVRF